MLVNAFETSKHTRMTTLRPRGYYGSMKMQLSTDLSVSGFSLHQEQPRRGLSLTKKAPGSEEHGREWSREAQSMPGPRLRSRNVLLTGGWQSHSI